MLVGRTRYEHVTDVARRASRASLKCAPDDYSGTDSGSDFDEEKFVDVGPVCRMLPKCQEIDVVIDEHRGL